MEPGRDGWLPPPDADRDRRAGSRADPGCLRLPPWQSQTRLDDGAIRAKACGARQENLTLAHAASTI